MTRSNKKLMSLVVAVMYALCILVAAPVQASAVTGHNVAAYTTAQKNTATKTALAALAKLPANADAAAKYTTSASLQKLVTAADKALATAKKMKLATTKFKNYGRLAIAKKAVAALVAAEKKAADEKAAEADKAAAEAVVAKIKLIPEKVTAADEATVNAAKTAYDALTANGKTLVTNAATLTAAVAKLADMKATFSVTSVKASSAKTFKVVFSKAVPDTAKIVFEVKKMNTVVPTTATWNDAKTEATLTGAAAYAEATYSVNVKNDTTDLGTTTVAITAQKVSKIQIVSTKLAVNDSGNKGYASYKVFDQYDNDVTNTYLAQNINWTSVVTPTAKDGVLTLDGSGTPATNFLTFQTVAINGYDSTNGVSCSANLTIAVGTGTLSEIKIGNIDNIKLAADDLTSVYYIPYTAKDLAGNETKSYDLMEQGLYFFNTTTKELASSPYVTVKLVRDPADTKKAAIELKVKTQSPDPITDLPVVFTVMTKGGVSQTVNTTLYKGSQVATITLMAPADVVAVGDDNVVVPFEAYDQAGKKLTKYSDLIGTTATPKVSFSSNLLKTKKVDGTLELKINPDNINSSAITNKNTPIVLTATVQNTGKVSTLNLTVQEAAKADELFLDTEAVLSAMETNAEQRVDFGDDMGGLSMKDQYDRDMDMTDGLTNLTWNATPALCKNYKVFATSLDTSKVIITNAITKSGACPTTGANDVVLTAGTSKGSATITFDLFNDKDNDNVVDAGESVDVKTLSMSVIDPTDVNDFIVSAPTTPIYGFASSAIVATDRDREYSGKVKIYGKTSGGSKVKLASSPVVSASVSNTEEFYVRNINNTYDYNGARFVALKLKDASKTTGSTTATINVLHNGDTYALTANLTSSTELPKAVSVNFGYDAGLGAAMKVQNDVIYIHASTNTTALADAGFANTKYIAKWTSANAAASTAGFYLQIVDNYGKKGMMFSEVKLVKAEHVTQNSLDTRTNAMALAAVSVSAQGELTVGTVAKGDEFTFSGFASNGLVKTIKVVID